LCIKIDGISKSPTFNPKVKYQTATNYAMYSYKQNSYRL